MIFPMLFTLYKSNEVQMFIGYIPIPLVEHPLDSWWTPWKNLDFTTTQSAVWDSGVTVKGQSRSDSLLLSPSHWAKLLRGVVAIVAVPMRFALICWIVLEAFVGQIHSFRLGSWMTIQVLGLSRISFLKSYREAVRLEKVQVSHHHNF